MGRLYTSAVEAIAAESCCNIQLNIDLPIPPIPGAPLLQLPDFPSIPGVNFYCPCDDEAEVRLE